MCQQVTDIGSRDGVWQLQCEVIRGGSVMRLFSAVVLATSLLWRPAAAQTTVDTPPDRLACPGDLVVWLNSETSVYQFKGGEGITGCRLAGSVDINAGHRGRTAAWASSAGSPPRRPVGIACGYLRCCEQNRWSDIDPTVEEGTGQKTEQNQQDCPREDTKC